MDINLELAELIHKYHVDEFTPRFYISYKAENLAKKIIQLLGNVILVGTKLTDIKWFQRTVCGEKAETLFLEGENADELLQEFENYKGVFLVISYYGRDEVMVKLLGRGFRAVCLYEEFEKEGMLFTDDFYDIYGEGYHKRFSKEMTRDFVNFDINKIFFDHRRCYELETKLQNRKIALKKLIFDCAYARDFLTLKKYIDTFQEHYAGEEGERYLSFYKEVEQLLSRIKSTLAERKQKDCIMIWLDMLEYGEDSDMPFLKSLDESSLVFTNAYTVTAYTSHTLKTIFAKKRSVEEEAFKMDRIGKRNSVLMDELKQRNYMFQYYGMDEMAARFEYEYAAKHFYSLYYSFTQCYWDILNDILNHNTEEAFLCVLHEMFQTHSPFVSLGLMEESYICYLNKWPGYQPQGKLCDGQALESRKYVDRQLEFYGGLLPEKMFKIYMSDHGHTLLGRYHCILKIQQKELKPQIYENLFSWYDFDKLVLGLIDGRSIEQIEIQNDYVIIQDTEYYGRDFIIRNLKTRTISPTILESYGFQGVVTKEDLFIRYNDGAELYQKKHNDGYMVTDDRLDYLRGITSKKRIDLPKEEKFKYSCLVQQVRERCRVRTAERQETKLSIVRNVFAEITDEEVIALWGGGLSSLRLLMLLDETSRKKISYVIDEDKECYAGKMGIKVIFPGEMKECQIDKVMIVSCDRHREWKTECNSDFKANVVDLYEILEQQGIECQKDIYDLEYADEDFEGVEMPQD